MVQYKVGVQSDIGISVQDREAIGRTLNAIVADEFVLYTKTRNYHWNVTGPQFGQFHKLFEEQYQQLNEIVDDVAERARQMGVNALGTLQEFSQQSRLGERPGFYPSALDMVSELATDHETVIRALRDSVDTIESKHHDKGTGNFLTDVMEQHEKMAWMLRAHLEGDTASR